MHFYEYNSLFLNLLVFRNLSFFLLIQGSVKEMLNLTQQEYMNRIEELNQALRESWEQDQRVKALKIGIQVVLIIDI